MQRVARSNKKLRVCFPFVGDTIGGSHVASLLLVQALKDSEVEPIVALHRDGLLADYLRERNIEYVMAPNGGLKYRESFPRKIATVTHFAPRLANFLRRERLDIVHSNDGLIHMTWLPAAKIAGARFVWHQHRLETSRLVEIYSRMADTVVVVSNFCQANSVRGLREKSVTLDNPFDTATMPPARDPARTKLLHMLGAPQNAFVVGYVANMQPYKRPHVFVEMAHQTAKHFGKSIRFPIIGDSRFGESDGVATLIERLGLSGQCLMLGPRFPIEPIFAGFDILVAPAIGEPFGRTLVEAMLVGTPVVASDDGGHREILQHDRTGILVPPDDPDAFADAVRQLLLDPPRRHRLADEAMRSVRARFSVERHAAAMMSIYQSLGRGRGHSRDLAGDTIS